MKVDHVLLLAAGKGTRMGDIGKSLPKVQWPVFEKSLLELQVAYAKELVDTNDIYINLFHDKENIHNFIRSNNTFNSVHVIKEEEPLDIGGAVHNLAKKLGYKGNLLILNSDQFLYFKREIFEEGLELLNEADGVLFSYEVNSNDLYGALEIKDGIFKGVVANEKVPRNQIMKTYTGMSLWNLETLDKVEGRSYFFESVANANKKTIKVLDIKEFEYWDFGTLKRYYNTMFKVLDDRDTDFKKFLIKNKALDESKIGLNRYHSKSGINLSGENIEECFKSIYMTSSELTVDKEESSIIHSDLKERIDLA